MTQYQYCNLSNFKCSDKKSDNSILVDQSICKDICTKPDTGSYPFKFHTYNYKTGDCSGMYESHSVDNSTCTQLDGGNSFNFPDIQKNDDNYTATMNNYLDDNCPPGGWHITHSIPVLRCVSDEGPNFSAISFIEKVLPPPASPEYGTPRTPEIIGGMIGLILVIGLAYIFLSHLGSTQALHSTTNKVKKIEDYDKKSGERILEVAIDKRRSS